MRHIGYLLAGLAMLLAAGFAVALTPHTLMVNERRALDLEAAIPKQFGDWHMVKTANQIIDPQVQAELNQIYSQTLARTYINSKGQQIMLSIAYGGTQDTKLQVHRPEVCYASDGFHISGMRYAHLDTPDGPIPVMHLVARKGERNEPITYWIMIGNTPVRGNIEQGIARIKYGLRGIVPDGLLFRVSDISAHPQHSYQLQQEFINQLLAVLSPVNRKRLAGQS